MRRRFHPGLTGAGCTHPAIMLGLAAAVISVVCLRSVHAVHTWCGPAVGGRFDDVSGWQTGGSCGDAGSVPTTGIDVVIPDGAVLRFDSLISINSLLFTGLNSGLEGLNASASVLVTTTCDTSSSALVMLLGSAFFSCGTIGTLGGNQVILFTLGTGSVFSADQIGSTNTSFSISVLGSSTFNTGAGGTRGLLTVIGTIVWNTPTLPALRAGLSLASCDVTIVSATQGVLTTPNLFLSSNSNLRLLPAGSDLTVIHQLSTSSVAGIRNLELYGYVRCCVCMVLLCSPSTFFWDFVCVGLGATLF